MNGTNLELFGSELEQRIKLASADHEPAWTRLNRSPGTTVWRVNKFHLDLIEPDGLFHTSDSYVILNIVATDRDMLYNVHFWLGAETTQDEAGTAVYKTVELDTWLDSKATQLREIQFNESELFKSYFRAGLRYADGGNASGFHHVIKPAYPTILYRIQDSRVKQIPLVINSITEDDVFMLDLGEEIHIYRGQHASHKEAILAEYEALDCKSVRPGTVVIHIESLEQKTLFLELVGSQTTSRLVTKFYVIKNETVEELDQQAELNSNYTYIMQYGCDTWIWVGSQSKVDAWRVALKLTKPTDRLRLVREGFEPEAFWLSATSEMH